MFTYTLPANKIAKYPPKVRGQSKLLHVDRQNSTLKDHSYQDLVDLLTPGTVLVRNNTQVLHARLRATRPSGAQVELLLLERHGKSVDPHVAYALVKGKVVQNEHVVVDGHSVKITQVNSDSTAQITSTTDIYKLANISGEVPLPPYLKRKTTKEDAIRYQTVFAKESGSVASPTASLNFTQSLEEKLLAKGVIIADLTLHVGLGTFLPIRTDDINKHKMHKEWFSIPYETASLVRRAHKQNQPIVALGTTVTRCLEYAHSDIISGSKAISGEADIFIHPGYKFKMITGLLTNFHAPKSTVLMMAAAFAGEDLLERSYKHALCSNYQFLSYGDSMLIQ